VRKSHTESGIIHLLVVTLIFAIFVVTGAFFLSNKQGAVKESGLTVGNITVSLGETFTLKSGQTANLSDTDISIRLEGFPYYPQFEQSPAPIVHTKKFKGGEEVESLDSFYYYLAVKDTDYDSYATYSIDHIDVGCLLNNKSGSSGLNECWRGLAKRLEDINYCYKIDNQGTKEFCYEELADLTGNSKLCEGIRDPKSYCMYLEAINKNDLSLCNSIITSSHSSDCYFQIAQKQGGITICQSLESDDAYYCERAFEE